ncbi:MAG: type II toxin-antitoxin system RelE/ParE family toxin [Ignavibacteria bacterium]
MAYEIRWTENAFEDLEETFDYIAKDWSSKVCQEFLENFFLKIELISNFPNLGIQSEIDKSVRKISVSKYLVLYFTIE